MRFIHIDDESRNKLKRYCCGRAITWRGFVVNGPTNDPTLGELVGYEVIVRVTTRNYSFKSRNGTKIQGTRLMLESIERATPPSTI